MKRITLGTLDTSNLRHLFPSLLKYLLILVSVYFICVYIWVALNRIGYPFELEWQEGAFVDHCRWILAGRTLYSAPDLAFTPFFYPPLYFFISSLAMRLTGVGFLAPRLVSFISSLGVYCLIYILVRRETGSLPGALLASGIFAAAYRATGAWLDIARIDSLFIFWVVLGIYCAGWGKGRWGPLITALIFSLAFHTKQFALLPALVVGFYYLLINRRQFLIYIVVFVIGTGVGFLLLNIYYRNWYWFYVVKVPASHKLIRKQLIDFWARDILRVFPVAFAGVIYFWAVTVKDFSRGRGNPRRLLYLLLSASLIIVSWIGRGNLNSYDNTLIPGVLAFSLVLGIEAGFIWKKRPSSPVINTVISLLILIQFILLFYLPGKQIPGASDRQAGERFINYLERIPGGVFVPYHGFLPFLAGKQTSAHWVAILDVLIAGQGSQSGPARDLLDQLEDVIMTKKYEVLILDRDDWFSELIEGNYRKERVLFPENGIFFPITGYRTRPRFIYRRIFPGEKF